MLVRISNEFGVVSHTFVTKALERPPMTFELPQGIELVNSSGDVIQAGSNVANEVASKGWVAEQISEIMKEVGDSIALSITNGIQLVLDSLYLGAIEITIASSIIYYVYCCGCIMFSVKDVDKKYSGVFFSIMVIMCAILAKSNL